MNKLLLLPATALVWAALLPSAFAQRFAKYEIEQTGYYAYFPADPGKFDYAESEDGLPVYTTETVAGDNSFGLILVLLDESFAGQSREELETLLMTYLDYLQETFDVMDAAGYGKGHTLESHPEALGVLDYWEDFEETQYVVKGWVDSRALAVLFIYGPELPAEGVQQMYLNGFRFKEN